MQNKKGREGERKQRDETNGGERRRADNDPAIAPLHEVYTLVPYYCTHIPVQLFVYTTTAGLRAPRVRTSHMVITPKWKGSCQLSRCLER